MTEIVFWLALLVWVGIGSAVGLAYYQQIRSQGEPATMALVKAIIQGAIAPLKKSIENLTALWHYLKS